MELINTVRSILAGNYESNKFRVLVRPNVLFSCRELNGKIRIDFRGEKPEIEIKYLIYINISLEYIEISDDEITVKASNFPPLDLKISDFPS